MSEPTESPFFSMDCEEVRDLLYLYVTGELDEEEATAVARHLESCADCRLAADEHTVLVKTLPSGFVNRKLFYYAKNV